MCGPHNFFCTEILVSANPDPYRGGDGGVGQPAALSQSGGLTPPSRGGGSSRKALPPMPFLGAMARVRVWALCGPAPCPPVPHPRPSPTVGNHLHGDPSPALRRCVPAPPTLSTDPPGHTAIKPRTSLGIWCPVAGCVPAGPQEGALETDGTPPPGGRVPAPSVCPSSGDPRIDLRPGFSKAERWGGGSQPQPVQPPSFVAARGWTPHQGVVRKSHGWVLIFCMEGWVSRLSAYLDSDLRCPGVVCSCTCFGFYNFYTRCFGCSWSLAFVYFVPPSSDVNLKRSLFALFKKPEKFGLPEEMRPVAHLRGTTRGGGPSDH